MFRPADVPLLTTSCLLGGSWESCSLILTWYAPSSMSPFLQNLLLIVICHRQANKSRISYPDIRNERAVWLEQRLGTSVSSSLQMSFIGHQAQQVVLALSDLHGSFLSPAQSVLLFQRCRLLLACLQYNSQLAQHLRSNFREEFRLAGGTLLNNTLKNVFFECHPNVYVATFRCA